MKSLSLGTKLLALAMAGVVATIVVAAIGSRGLSALSATSQELERSVVLQRSQMMADMMHDGIRGAVYKALLDAKTKGVSADDRRDAADLGKSLLANIDSVSRMTDDSLVRAKAQESRIIAERYWSSAERVIEGAASAAADIPERTTTFDARFSALEEALGKLGDLVEADASATADRASAKGTEQQRLLIIIAACTLALVAFGNRVISRSIRRPIQRITTAAEQLATGDTNLAVQIEGADEIARLGEAFRTVVGFVDASAKAADAVSRGDLSTVLSARSSADALAHSMNRSADTLRRLDAEVQRLVRAAREGQLEARADLTGFDGAYRALLSGINAMVAESARPIQEAAEVLDRLAERDLAARMTGQYAGQYTRVQTSLNSAAEHMEHALREVRTTSTELSAASQQVSASSHALAEGATEQASALEEVSASLQELASLARQNAEASARANASVRQVGTQAAQGTTSMTRLTEAMHDIHRSASETARIMKTIDEIAFQTNLLALNAAVEAARAGDAGRGFAVVADEVRALALRSATAARESADLIERSVQHAQRGVALNDETAQAFTAISAAVQGTAAVVDEISMASQQQAEGVAQILKATEEMNQVTQRAASESEESAAVSQTLLGQAHILTELLDRFAFSEDGDVNVFPTRNTPASGGAERGRAYHPAGAGAATASW
jgi:methyl-accepting chemotaxis protein